MKFNTKGLDELQRKVKQLDGTHSVPLDKLLTPSFLQGRTHFASMSDFEQKASARGFNAKSQAEWDCIPKHELDAFIAANSSFHTWQDLLKAAGVEYVKKQLGFS